MFAAYGVDQRTTWTPLAVSNIIVDSEQDVALLRLAQPLNVFGGTHTINNVLGLQEAQDLKGKTLTCYGYGYDTKRKPQDSGVWGAPYLLRYANTQKVTNDTGVLEDGGIIMHLDAVTQAEWHGDSGGPCFYTSGSYRYEVMTFSNWTFYNEWDPLDASGPSSLGFRDWVWYWMFNTDIALAGGSGFTFGPGIAAPDSTHLQVFAPGGDKAMWEDIWNGTSWSGWRTLSGTFTSAAAASQLSSSTSLVFARGNDSAIWYTSAKTDGTASTWTSLGGVLLGAPAAVNANDGNTYVFARGTDSKLYYRRYNGSTWTAWAAISGGQLLGSDASAASMAKGWVHVFSLAQNGSLQYTWLQPGKSWQWANLGGSYVNPPAATSSGANQLDLFIRGATDNKIYYRKYYGIWAPYWTNLDYVTTSNPAVVSRATGLIDLVFRGSSNEMRYATSGY
jgi:hypothetical protein